MTRAYSTPAGGADLQLVGYPLHMVHAEKVVTAVQRGTANTRWRDFGDVWTLTRRHTVVGTHLRRAIEEVARHRNTELVLLAGTLKDYPVLAQPKWLAWRRRSGSEHLPEEFGPVLDEIIRFADPVLDGSVDARIWNPASAEWQPLESSDID